MLSLMQIIVTDVNVQFPENTVWHFCFILVLTNLWTSSANLLYHSHMI